MSDIDIAGYNPYEDTEGCYYDDEAAERAVGFFRDCLTHVKGELAADHTPFELDTWQENIIATLFGWKLDNGYRRFRTSYIEIPRKNGKSTLAAGLALYMLISDGEAGAEVYSAAAEREQASIVFDIAAQMVAAEPILRENTTVFRKSISVERTGSSYKVLSADAYTKHGLNASAIIFDELHAQPNRDLWDVLTTSTGARTQPLIVALTTAGYDRNSICYQLHDYAIKVRDGIIKDQTFLPVIYAADEKDDFKLPETWAKANPALGISIRTDYLEREAFKATEMSSYENTFRRLHLNQWTQQDIRWIPMDRWDEANTFAEFGSRPCWGGLDLASVTDIAALVLVCPDDDGGYDVMAWHWIPEENAHKRTNRDRVPYDTWVKDKLITATEGDVIHFGAIREDILKIQEKFNLQDIAVDRWNSHMLIQELESEGVNIALFGMGFRSLSSPSKMLETLIMGRHLHHGDNPVLRWMASNCSIENDPAGNIKPSKKKSTEKIDSIVALIMAIARATAGNETGSVYDERGITLL